MAVMRIVEAAATTEQYDRANEIMMAAGGDQAPEGLIHHVAASDGDGLVIADVWESEDAFEQFFAERLGPALQQAGMMDSPPTQRTMPVHNMLEGRGQNAGVLLVVEIEGFTPDLYDKMTEGMDVHAGGGGNHPSVWHVAAVNESGGLVVADVWESPEAFGQFAEEVIGPRGAEVGLQPFEPRLIPIHNSVRGSAAART